VILVFRSSPHRRRSAAWGHNVFRERVSDLLTRVNVLVLADDSVTAGTRTLPVNFPTVQSVFLSVPSPKLGLSPGGSWEPLDGFGSGILDR